MKIIDKELLETIRLTIGEISLIESIDDIVPLKLRHIELLNELYNPRIGKNILKYYYLNNTMFQYEISEVELNRIASNSSSKLELFLPYSISIYGAYFSRSDFYTKIGGLVSRVFKYKINGKQVDYLDDLIPYFKEYSKGFEKGFNEFENEIIKPYLPLFPDKADFSLKVFNHIRGGFLNSWSSTTGFAFNAENNEITNAFEDGQKQGLRYRAWCYIFSNSKLFETLFDAMFVSYNRKTEIDTNDNTNTLTIDKSEFEQLPNSDYPVIDTKIIDPEFILAKYQNKAFECSRKAFYAWLVYGKRYEVEKIKWTFRKGKNKPISKAQLKMFIDKITNTDTAKKTFFNNVFGVEVNKADYRNSKLDPYFKELSTKMDINKLKVK